MAGPIPDDVDDFNTKTRTPRTRPVIAHSGQVLSVSFSPDSRTLVAYDDGRGLLWDLRPSTWTKQACSIAGRTLYTRRIGKRAAGPRLRPSLPRALRANPSTAARARIGLKQQACSIRRTRLSPRTTAGCLADEPPASASPGRSESASGR
jgi:WD40 repeat protein